MNTMSIPKEKELDYLRDTLLGGRQYCLKEPLSSLPKARIQLKLYDEDNFFYLLLNIDLYFLIAACIAWIVFARLCSSTT